MEKLRKTDRLPGAGRYVRALATVGGVLLIAWTVLFADFSPRSVIFDITGSSSAAASEAASNDLSRLRLLTRCVGYIRSAYVVPERVRPMAMLSGSLKAAEALVPDLMVTFNNQEPEKATSVEVRIGDVTKVFPLQKVSDLYQMNWRLLDIFEFISPNLPSDVKSEEVEYAAINGMLQPLDEHSMYLSPDAFEQMQLDTQGRFGGLGIVISSRKGYVTVVTVIDDTPAWRSGLKTGDQIIEIDDESTMNLLLTDAVSKLRGEPGTEVRILVVRKGWDEPKPFKLERAVIKVQSVKSEVLGNGIGYVRLLHFQEDTSDELSRQLSELKRKDSLKGLVLDLRQDPGGLLDQAVKVADLFLPDGTVVVTQGEGDRMRQEYQAERGDAFENLPVVMLVDGGSASAAEIVAGALKYNDRALLVGSTTFGKGTVQVMYEVGKGALKLTIAQYLIPGDLSIQGVGVVPDIELVPASIGKKNMFMGLPDYKRFRNPERRLDAFGKIADDIPLEVIPYLVKPAATEDEESDVYEEPPVEDDKFEKDEAIEIAAGILTATSELADVSRASQLKNGSAAISAWKAAQDRKISVALEERSVDWSSGPVVSSPQVSAVFSYGTKPLVAGSNAVLSMSVTNNSNLPLFRVRCSTSSDNNQLDAREFILGRIEPGKTVTRDVHFKVPRETWERRDLVEFRLYQNAVEGMSSVKDAIVDFVPVKHPRFGFVGQVLDRGGNGDGVLNPGERADVVFNVQNLGDGDAPKVMASLRNRSGEGLYLRSGRETLSDGIPAGKSRTVKFKVERRKEDKPGQAKVEFSVLDLAIREYLSEEIVLASSAEAGQAFTERVRAVQTIRPDIEMLSAASADAQVLHVVPEGTKLRSTGFFPGYYKIDLQDGLWGFIKSADVRELTEAVKFDDVPVIPLATNVAPFVDVTFTPVVVEDRATPVKPGEVRTTDINAIRVQGKIVFENGKADIRRKVLVFRGTDKVYFWTRKGSLDERVVNIDTVVKLQKGRNPLAVYAIEGSDRSAVRRYNVFLSEKNGVTGE